MNETCEIEATVASGLEWVAKDETWRRLGINSTIQQGRIFIRIPVADVKKVLELRCIDHLYVVIMRKEGVEFASNLVDACCQIENFVFDADWSLGLKVWSKFVDFKSHVSAEPHKNWTKMEKMSTLSNRLNGTTLENRLKDSCDSDVKKKSAVDQVYGKTVESESNCSATEQESPYSVQRNKTSEACGQILTENQKIIDLSSSCRSPFENTIKPQVTDKIQTENCDPFSHATKPCDNLPDNCDSNESWNDGRQRENEFNPGMPRFRTTCYRTGQNHCFRSQQAARFLGSRLNDYFGWNVDLSNYDIETVLNIRDREVYVTVALTKQSQHHRNIKYFGKMSLRPTICSALLRIARLKPGDVVCDPMAGSGVIAVEGVLGHPDCYHIAGELETIMAERSGQNMHCIREQNKKLLSADIFQWDVRRLPFRDNSIDVIVTDLPFGKRSGSKMQNWTLYPDALREMARVTQLETGRACLLTMDRKCILRSLKKVSDVWVLANTSFFNHGGLSKTAVYLLKRTAKATPKKTQ